MSEFKQTTKNTCLLLVGLLTCAIISSCLSQNEYRAQFAITQLFHAKECKVYHGITTESINGVSQPAKWTITLKVNGIEDLDKISHKEMLTSLAALRYYQWEDTVHTKGYEQICVIISGENISLRNTYPMSIIAQASAMEPMLDSLFKELRDKRMDRLRNLLDARISDSEFSTFTSALMTSDSTYGTLQNMSVLGFSYGIDEGAPASEVKFYIGMQYAYQATTYLDVGVSAENHHITRITSFNPKDGTAVL